MYESLHFLKIFLQIPRNLSDFRKFWATESPYIHSVSAPVKEFSTAAVVSSSIENSIEHTPFKNCMIIMSNYCPAEEYKPFKGATFEN